MDAQTSQAVQAYWPIFLTGIIFIAGYSQLIFRVKNLEKDKDEDAAKATRKETVLWGKLDSMQATILALVREVAKLEGVLQTRRD